MKIKLRFGKISCQVKNNKIAFCKWQASKNKNKVQKIIVIVNVMRTINPYTHTHGRLITSFQTKENPIDSTYLSVKIMKIKIKTLQQIYQ